MKVVRFKGKFKDLIPAGWIFQKLFAHNYRQYHKTCDGSEYGQSCRIWQHLGGYLEIQDLFDLSWVVVQQIADGKIKEWESNVPSIFRKRYDSVYWFRIDTKKGIFYPCHSDGYKKLNNEMNSFFMFPKRKGTSKKANAFFERYREFQLNPKLITMIKDLLDKGWIEVVEVEDRE